MIEKSELVKIHSIIQIAFILYSDMKLVKIQPKLFITNIFKQQRPRVLSWDATKAQVNKIKSAIDNWAKFSTACPLLFITCSCCLWWKPSSHESWKTVAFAFFTVDYWSCGATEGVLALVSSLDVKAPSSKRTCGSANSPEMKQLNMLDMFSFSWKEALEQQDSMEFSDLCPVRVLICLGHILWSESTVTDVAWMQWLVRWGAIPSDVDMFFIMFSSVLFPTGELQYHISSFYGWKFVDTSLGPWNRASRLGFRC